MRILPIQPYNQNNKSIPKASSATRRSSFLLERDTISFQAFEHYSAKRIGILKNVTEKCNGFGFTEKVINLIVEKSDLRNRDYTGLMNWFRDVLITPDFNVVSTR